MKEELDSHVISTLQMEYDAMRQEIRDLVNSMDKNLSVGVAMLGGIFALASYSEDAADFLYIIPSIIFLSTLVHLIKTASASVHGAYCQVIEARLKQLLGQENVLLDWEGGEISQYISSPKSAVQLGFYIFFVAILGIFGTVAYFAYLWDCRTVIIHAFEIIIILVYAYVVISRDATTRTEIKKHYLGAVCDVGPQQQSTVETQHSRKPDA